MRKKVKKKIVRLFQVSQTEKQKYVYPSLSKPKEL